MCNKSNLKGQSSVEALLILAVAIAFIIPLALIFFSSSALGLETLSQLQTKALAQHISDAAGQVWYEGPGARKTILVSYPDGIESIRLSGDDVTCFLIGSERVCHDDIKYKGRDIVLTLALENAGKVQIDAISPAPMKNEYFRDAAQNLNYKYSPTDEKLTAGLVVLVVKNEGPYVNVVRYVDGLDY